MRTQLRLTAAGRFKQRLSEIKRRVIGSRASGGPPGRSARNLGTCRPSASLAGGRDSSGEAAGRDECEVLVEDEMEYQRLRGYIRVTAEAVELCEQCEGEGSIPVEDGIMSICDACGGRIGILSTFKRGRGAEMMSTQFHLRAAS